jgi:hypothetical protein
MSKLLSELALISSEFLNVEFHGIQQYGIPNVFPWKGVRIFQSLYLLFLPLFSLALLFFSLVFLPISSIAKLTLHFSARLGGLFNDSSETRNMYSRMEASATVFASLVQKVPFVSRLFKNLG